MEFFALIFNKDETQLFQEIFYRKFLKYDKSILFLLLVSLVIAVLEENFFFQENHELIIGPNDEIKAIFYNDSEDAWTLLLRITNTLITLIIDFCLIKRKLIYYYFLKSCFLIRLEKGFFRSSFLIELIIEVLAVHVQSYPEIDGFYASETLNRSSFYFYDTTLTAIFIMIRTILLIRCLLYLSIFASAKSSKICFNSGAKSGLLFTMRSEFHHNTQRFVMIFISLYILILGFLIRLCERSFMQLSLYDWDYVWNSFWIIIVDMTSVGYGDFVPITNFGRIIIGIAAIGGGAITSLIYIIFLERTSFDFREEKAYERLKAYESKQNFKLKAMKCISLSLKFNAKRRKTRKKRENIENEEIELENFLVDIHNNVKDFSLLRKTITEFTFARKINEIIRFLKDKLNDDFDYVNSYLTIMDFFEKKIDILSQNMELLSECLSNFEDIFSQTIMSLQYLQDNVMKIFLLPKYEIFNDLNVEKSNCLLLDLINSAQNSVQYLRKSITVNENTEEIIRPRFKTIDTKILAKIEKNRLISLKKINPLALNSFSSLQNHAFFCRFLKKTEFTGTTEPKHVENLCLSNGEKIKNIMELSMNRESLNSKLEGQRKSLAYRISVISESKFNISGIESRNSYSSEEIASRKNSVTKKSVVKRFEKKELTCLAEEFSRSSSLKSIENSEDNRQITLNEQKHDSLVIKEKTIENDDEKNLKEKFLKIRGNSLSAKEENKLNPEDPQMKKSFSEDKNKFLLLKDSQKNFE